MAMALAFLKQKCSLARAKRIAFSLLALSN